ncbi:MAG: hypothetical protein HYR56_18390 [Acidobacteria bacterium]|nr:hypothetical protein [Acidobacteriota bacterium]
MSGYIALLVAIIVSRIINERGYRRLSADEKVRLMDGFSAARAYSLIPLVILILAFYLMMTQTSFDPKVVSVGYFTLLIGYVIVRAVLNQRRMKTLQLPLVYQKYFTLSQVLSMLGVAWFFFTMLYGRRMT